MHPPFGSWAKIISTGKKNNIMKKIILGGVAAIAIAVLATVNVNMSSQNDNLLSDLALANVEALAGAVCPAFEQRLFGQLCCRKKVFKTVPSLNKIVL
jgi:hypothetical protein